jgi:hypothetical protein
MGVHGMNGDPAYPKMNKLKKHIKLGILGKVISSAFKKLKWHCWPSYSAINTKNIFINLTASSIQANLLANVPPISRAITLPKKSTTIAKNNVTKNDRSARRM